MLSSSSFAVPVAVVVLLSSLAVACGDDGSATVDAHPIDAELDAWMPTGSAKSHTLFVQTEGAIILPGFDDATMNRSSLVTASSTLHGWRLADPGAVRQARITQLVTDIDTILSAYDIHVVTARPAAGPYDMVVIADDDSGALAGVRRGLLSATPTSCNATPSVISMIFPRSISQSSQQVQRDAISGAAIAMFGVVAGVPQSTVPQDCMCGGAAPCIVAPTGPCHIGGPGTTIDPVVACGVPGPTMDEGALLLAAFGPR